MVGGGLGGAWAAGGFAGAAGLAATGFSPGGWAGSGLPAADSTPSGLGSSAIQYPCKITTINTRAGERQIQFGFRISDFGFRISGAVRVHCCIFVPPVGGWLAGSERGFR